MVFAMANPNAGGHARGGRAVRADHGHRPQRLPEPDQQRLAFPGIFRGALDVRAPADHRGDEDGRRARRSPTIVPEDELREDYIIPSVFNRDVAPAVAEAVAAEARRAGGRSGF